MREPGGIQPAAGGRAKCEARPLGRFLGSRPQITPFREACRHASWASTGTKATRALGFGTLHTPNDKSVSEKRSPPPGSRARARKGRDPLGPQHEDALNAYLSHMSRLPLLSRDGEVRVGQAIEDGTLQAHGALFSCPIAVRAIADVLERVQARRVRIVDIVRDAEDDPEGFDEIGARWSPSALAPAQSAGLRSTSRRGGSRPRLRRSSRRCGSPSRPSAVSPPR